MKQKIFSIIALVALMLMPQVMKAELSEVYNLTTMGDLGTAGEAADGETPYTKGGVAYAMNTLETNAWTAGATDETPWTIKGVGQYIKVTVANNFQAGDQIIIKGKGNGSFRIFDNNTGSTSSDAYAFQQAMNKNTEAEYTLTVGADNLLIGKNTFYLRWSSGSNEGSLYFIKVNQDPTAETYTITVADGIANGAVEVNATSARAGVEITMMAIPNDGYELDKFSVKQGDTDVAVDGNKFTMPAGNVVVSATFVQEVIPENAIFYLKTTGDFGTDNGDGTFTKDGVTYEKSGLNNTADTSHNPSWWRNAKTTNYLGCILPATLQAGDKIVIAGRASAASIKIRLRNVGAVSVTEGEGETATTTDTEFIEIATGTTEESTFEYTVAAGDILDGKSKLYVMQSSTSSLYMKSVMVLSNSALYNITVNETTHGTVSPSSSQAVEGATVTLTIAPDENYELETIAVEAVTEDEGDTPTFVMMRAPSFVTVELTKVDDTHYTFVMPGFNVNVTATFKQKEVPPTPTRTLTVSKQWTAFCSPETFTVPEGLKVYIVTALTQPSGEEAGVITLKEQQIIAENVPMIIENTVIDTQTQFTIENTTGEITDARSAEFKGSATGASDLDITSANYVLKNGVFVRTTATKVSQYSCYIEFASGSAARTFVFGFDEGTTGIQSLGTAVLNDGQWYNLHGVQVAQPTQKGIYIHNGKKVVIK